MILVRYSDSKMDLTTELDKIKEMQKIATIKLLERFSEYFKKKHNIVDDRIVLLVHYWSDNSCESSEYTNLEFFDKDFTKLESHRISDRYNKVEVDTKYKHLVNDYINTISSDDLP